MVTPARPPLEPQTTPPIPPIGRENSRLADCTGLANSLTFFTQHVSRTTQTIRRVPALHSISSSSHRLEPSRSGPSGRIMVRLSLCIPCSLYLSLLPAASGAAKQPGQTNMHLRWAPRAKSCCRPAPSLHAVYPPRPISVSGTVNSAVKPPAEALTNQCS